MKSRWVSILCRASLLLTLPGMSSAALVTIGFDDLYDLTPISTEYASFGLEFDHATVLSAGVSLNELEFPPYSGTNVAFDDGGYMTVSFDGPVSSISGLFTYSVPIRLSAFDSSGTEVATVLSVFSSNMELSGDLGSSPNELLQLTGLTDIRWIEVHGDPLGGSFTVDNLAITFASEPGTASLVLGSFAVIAALNSRRRSDRPQARLDSAEILRVFR